METPLGTGLIVTRVMRMNKKSLARLLYESIELHHNINHYHLNLQNLWTIIPKNGSNTTTMKYQWLGFYQNITFIRIIMCRHEENICCIMINYEHTSRLLYRDLLLQDNGVVTIRTFISILVPHTIIHEM